MENAYAVGLTLLAFLSVCFMWRMWKSTMREVLRDKLIDLRDEWRNYYVEHALDMTDGRYAAVRDLLNGMLYGSSSLRFVGFWYYVTHIDTQTSNFAAKMSAKLVDGATAEMRQKIASIRMRACLAVLVYVATTSIGILFYVPYKITGAVSMVFAEKILSGLKNLFTINENSVVCAATSACNLAYV